DHIDKASLEGARDRYGKAFELNKLSHYAGMNVCRVTLLLSIWNTQHSADAEQGFKTQAFLCRYIAELDPNDHWSRLDLAEALLFTGYDIEAQQTFSDALELIPKELRFYVLD